MIDKSKLNKIGIDRVVINNFSILNFKNLEKKEIVNKFEYIEKFEFKDTYFSLSYSNNLKASGEIYNISALEFNPTKLFNGHNIYNSNLSELKLCLDKIYKNLLQNGINIDLSQAKIKEIEINTTFEENFEELTEVLMLIGRANHKKALGIYSFLDEDIPSKIRKDRSLYINTRTQDFKKDNPGKTIKFYDKTFEMYTSHDVLIPEKLTRLEILFGRDYYRNITEKYGISNSLNDFLANDITEKLFFESLEKEVVEKPKKYLLEIKKNLTHDFKNFKRNEKFKRAEREKLKKAGKNIPTIYKEERGVFNYLEKNSWIFDYRFLYEIINEHISSKHRKDYEKQIIKKYMNINNLELYEKLLKNIFGRFF